MEKKKHDLRYVMIRKKYNFVGFRSGAALNFQSFKLVDLIFNYNEIEGRAFRSFYIDSIEKSNSGSIL